VARGFERRQTNAAELDRLAVAKRGERVLSLGRSAEINGGAGPIAQFEMPGNEVRVKVREEDVRDPQTVLVGEGEVSIDVALGIDDRRRSRLLVADEVGRVREAIQIELVEDHARNAEGLRLRLSIRADRPGFLRTPHRNMPVDATLSGNLITLAGLDWPAGGGESQALRVAFSADGPFTSSCAPGPNDDTDDLVFRIR
jgi:hypothetical protein